MADSALILLAAGEASRMGQPKQLLEFHGRPLLRHCAETALASVCRPVIAVLGANAAQVRPALADLPLRIVVNDRWSEGVGTSIQSGLAALRADAVSSVILMLADQPLITAAILDDLVARHRASGLPIVACGYSETLGVPVLFGREVFAELQQLDPASGCKPILLRDRSRVDVRPCPEAAGDIDTPADYERVRSEAELVRGVLARPEGRS